MLGARVLLMLSAYSCKSDGSAAPLPAFKIASGHAMVNSLLLQGQALEIEDQSMQVSHQRCILCAKPGRLGGYRRQLSSLMLQVHSFDQEQEDFNV